MSSVVSLRVSETAGSNISQSIITQSWPIRALVGQSVSLLWEVVRHTETPAAKGVLRSEVRWCVPQQSSCPRRCERLLHVCYTPLLRHAGCPPPNQAAPHWNTHRWHTGKTRVTHGWHTGDRHKGVRLPVGVEHVGQLEAVCGEWLRGESQSCRVHVHVESWIHGRWNRHTTHHNTTQALFKYYTQPYVIDTQTMCVCVCTWHSSHGSYSYCSTHLKSLLSCRRNL